MLMSVVASSSLMAQELDLNEENVRIGYSIGVNIGFNLAGQGFLGDEVDAAAMLQGIRDALSDDLQLSDEEIMASLQNYSLQQQVREQRAMETNRQAGMDFLAENALAPGVVTTASGLQYMVLEESSDPNSPSPAASDTVMVHYHGTLIDGTVFDSSIQRGEPISFPLDGVIPGWTEGVQLMNVGDTYRLFIPSELAYGANGAGQVIGPHATLIFDVQLLDIE